MKLSRDLTLKIAFILDELIPPFIRDSKWFMYIPTKILFGKVANVFFEFREKVPYMTEKDYVAVYKKITPYLIKRETCVNRQCLDKILRSIRGKTVLEAGSGNAYIANKLVDSYQVTGLDILDPKDRYDNRIKFVKANIENMPFKAKSFDTVITTHTLEHVLDFQKAVAELRRVAKKRLIIVTPCQRPFKYTFDPHIRFFPYVFSFVTEMNLDKSVKKKIFCEKLGGDIYYQEDYK